MALPCLRDELGVECFLPMVGRARARKGARQVSEEPLFPGYVFVRVDLGTELRKVMHARGVRGFVRMGERYPRVDAGEVEALRLYCEQSLAVAKAPLAGLAAGDRVELLGALHGGVQGEVAALLPARNRVRVLIEFLGRSMEMEVAGELVLRRLNADG